MVNWLVIGIGDITRKRVIPAVLAEPRSKLYGVVTRDPRKAEAYPDARVWTSLEDALQDAAVDAVYVASPVALHEPHTVACFRAGRHVLCEKPVAMNYAEAARMESAARESGRLFGAAYYRRLYPKLVRAKKLIDDGAIGQPVLVEANCHGWFEAGARQWLLDPALAGGGPIYDIGSHRIDAVNFVLGRPVRAVGMRSDAIRHFGLEDSSTVVIGYESGAHGIVDVRWNSRVNRDQFRVTGTEGEIDLDPLNGPRLRFAGREEELPVHANVHYPIIENFAGAVLDGTPLASSGEEAIWTDWVTERAAMPGC